MLAPGWLVGSGKEALYGREVAWGAVKAEPVPIWFRLSFGWSAWNGLLGEGAFRPMWKEIKRKSLLLTPIQSLFFLKLSLEPDESMTSLCLSWRYSFKHTLFPKLIWDLKGRNKKKNFNSHSQTNWRSQKTDTSKDKWKKWKYLALCTWGFYCSRYMAADYHSPAFTSTWHTLVND